MRKRLQTESLGHNCWQVVINYGFKDEPDVARALECLKSEGCRIEPMTTSYFLSRDIVTPTPGSGMADWREKIFAQMHRNASAAASQTTQQRSGRARKQDRDIVW